MLGFEGCIGVCRAGRQQVDENESRRKLPEFPGHTPAMCPGHLCSEGAHSLGIIKGTSLAVPLVLPTFLYTSRRVSLSVKWCWCVFCSADSCCHWRPLASCFQRVASAALCLPVNLRPSASSSGSRKLPIRL